MSFMTKKLRSFVSIFALAFTAFALISCGDIADSASEKLAKADGKCTVRFSLENASRQANPEHLDPKKLSYTISYYQVIDETSEEEKSLGSQKEPLSYSDLMDAELELTVGKWFFELVAFKNGGSILHSVVSYDVGSNYENTIIFNLEEYANEIGTGTVLVNFTYDNEDVTSVTAQLLKFPSCEAISGYNEKSFTKAEITESGTTSNVNFSQVDVKTGSYILLFTVTRSDESVTKTPVFVIVRPGRESASYERELRKEESYLPFAIHFLFENEKGEYVENDKFPTFNVTEENFNSFETVIDDCISAIIQQGYTVSETKESSDTPVKLDDGTYAMYKYFDKFEVEAVLTATGSASDIEKYKEFGFKLTTYNNFKYEITYTDGDSILDRIVSTGTWNVNSDSDSITITETNYFDFANSADISELAGNDYKMATVESPTAQKINISDSFQFTSAGGPVITFLVGSVPAGPMQFDITVSGSALPTDKDPSTVTIYSISSQNAQALKEKLASSASNADKVEALVTLLEKHNETTPTDATYLGQYEPSSASTTETVTNPMTVKDGAISINDSYTTWGTMGRGNDVALVALVAYGDSSKITSYYVGVSDVFTVDSAETNTVEISASSIGVPCKVGFILDGNSDEENKYTVYASLNTLEMSISAIDAKTITSMEKVLASDGKLRLSGYTYDSISSISVSSGIPEISLAYKTKTSAASGISVTLGEVDTTDLGENFEMSVTESDGAVTVTATPMLNGYSYRWYLEGEPIDGATTSSYTWTEQMISNLDAGTYTVMLEITDNTGASGPYSASTTFTVTK
ncbi:hypothetical protein [uncultured Treponema sp.]|uniref:hypothetical protein n=1 Tax=uncultured Treponema sp. TaxID=162155 RepID=UPI0025FFBDF9|nr:hypothetical protein [uncultured Treponema sp.]